MRRLIRLDSTITAACWWAATRAIVIVLWLGPEDWVRGDVDYYFAHMQALFAGTPPAQVLVEYPTPVLWLLSLPYALSSGDQTAFLMAFMALLLALDALVLALLQASARWRRVDPTPAAWMWIAFVLLMGPITYLRLDLITTACIVVAVTTLGRPAAGALVGVGAATKLWPALLWPATLTDRRQLVRSSVAFAVTGGVLAAASWAWAGWDRLVSPLTWQSDRGLQIESLWAVPAMLAHLADPVSYPIDMSAYVAFEVSGPITGALVAASSWGMLLGGLALVALYVLWLRRPHRTPTQAGQLMIAATLIMIATNKTLSPQYLIWLGGALAATLALTPRASTASRRLLARTACWTLVITAATQGVFPLLYSYLIGYLDGPLVGWANVLLLARNIGLACLTVWFVVSVFREFWPGRDSAPFAHRRDDPGQDHDADADAEQQHDVDRASADGQ